MLKLFSNNGQQPARSAHVGKTFRVNSYKVVVEDLLAEGGFGVVYVVHTPQGDRYALKRIAVNNDADLHLCKQEIAITKTLSDCKHSVKFVDAVITSLSSDVYEVLILLHLYPGKVIDLMNERLQRGLTEQEILKIFTDVCEAVARLHHRTKPIMHRDIKIENILIDTDGEFVLCDFGSCSIEIIDPQKVGVATCEEQVEKFTTLAYRPPEMVDLYSGKLITTKSDIWALGCLLYKLCFFTTPFGEQRLAILSGSFTIPADSKYSDDLHSLIKYMLETDADQRPNIFQVCEVAFKLRRLSNPIPNVFGSPPPPKTLPRAPRMIPPGAIGQTPYATPNRLSALIAPTSQGTTTISSRDRPRPKSELLPLQMTPSQAPPQAPPPYSSVTSSRDPVAQANVDHFGFTPFVSHEEHSTMEDSTNQTFQVTTGDVICTDLFGAKPFSGPHLQQMDAFGTQPFTGTSHHEQPPPQANISAPTTVDVFGSQPFQ